MMSGTIPSVLPGRLKGRCRTAGSLGSARHLAFRPRDGGPSQRLSLGHGDLAVMGGACQRTWEHAVPKTSAAVGPRISIQYRVAGVR